MHIVCTRKHSSPHAWGYGSATVRCYVGPLQPTHALHLMATAKRKTAAKSAAHKKGPRAAEAQLLRVAYEPTLDTPTYYSNHFEVGHTRHEFIMLAGRVQGKLTEAMRRELEESGQLSLEPELQILLAPTLMPGLIRALTDQLRKWEEKFGAVPTTQEKQP